jgi:hypothetical protein
MSSLSIEHEFDVQASAVRVTDDTVEVDLEDGRTIMMPLVWLPRLLHATKQERENVNIMADGIEWPDVEADISIKGLLLGWKSAENPECFKYWLDNRKQGKHVTVMDWLALRKKEKQGNKNNET